MMHTRFALRRPVTTMMTFIALALIGVIAMRLLPLELFPDIRFPGIQVTIPYAGSTPEEVEQLITRPAEEAIATLSGIKEIRSTSSETGAELVVFFQWDRDPSAVGFEVRTKLESIRHEFPPSANRILTQMFAAGDDRVVAIRISSQEDLTRQYDTLDRYLKKPLERLDGVARVSLEGVEPLELRILVDPVRIAAHGVDIARLRDALEGANFSVSAGEITGGAQRFLVRPIGEFRTIDDVRNFIVTGNVRLHDLADVSLVTPELTVGRHLNGRPGVGLDVFKATGANIVDVAERVMAVVEEQRKLPQLQGIEVIVLQNQAENIRSSLSELRNAGLIGAGLALVVLFLFMRDWPTTLIVGLAVPFSLLITVAAMYFLGFSLNILTMMGMLLAIGLLVDNAVVVTESIFRHRQVTGADPIASTLTGVTEVGLAVLAGTLSTVIVFLPIIFGEESEIAIFMVHVAVPIVVAMLASLLVAQTLIPTLTARFPPPPPIRAGSFFARIQDWYLRRLDWLFAHKWWAALFVVLTVASPVPLFATGLVKMDMFPQDASDRLFLPYHIEGTYPLARTEEAVTRVEQYLEANKERFGIDLVYSYYLPDDASSVIRLKPRDELPMEPRELMKEIEKGIPEIIIGKPSFRFDEEQGQTGAFSMRLTGESTEELVALSRDVVKRLGDVKGLDAPRSTAKAGEHEVQVVVDRDRASRLGLSPQAVAQTVAVAMRGDPLKEFRADDREIQMRLAFRADNRQTLEDLAATPLYLPDGTRSTLGAVASFRIDQTARTIDRVDRLTSVVIEGIVADDSSLDEVKKGVEAVMERFPAAARRRLEIRPQRRGQRRHREDDADQHPARHRADLPGDGLAVRVPALPGIDPDVDRVRDRRRVLGPRDHGDADVVHGDAGDHDPDRRDREHRHRADRARDRPAQGGHEPPRRHPRGGAPPAAADPDDDGGDAARDAAARGRGHPDRRRRAFVLPDGARADVGAPVRLGDVAVLRAAVLRLARRHERLAPARQAALAWRPAGSGCALRPGAAGISAAGPCKRPSSRPRGRSHRARRPSPPAAARPVAARSRWHCARSPLPAIFSPRFLISASEPVLGVYQCERLRDLAQPRQAGIEVAVLGALDAAVVREAGVHGEAGHREPREQVLGVGDHREVHQAPTLDRQARELRPGLFLDRAMRLAHFAEVALGRDAALALRQDLRRKRAPLEVVPEALQLPEAPLALRKPAALGIRDFLRLPQALVRDLEPLRAVLLELRELLLALRVLAFTLELRREFLELLAAGPPQRLQAEMDQRVEPALGAAEQHFELLELLLQARVRVLLLLQLVAQVVQLVVEALQFLLELGAVPEQLQQPFLLGRISLADRRQLQLRPLVRKHDGHVSRSAGRYREAVAAPDAVFQPFVEQHVAGPALAVVRGDARCEAQQARMRGCGGRAAGLGKARVVVDADLEPGLALGAPAVAEQVGHLQRGRVAALLDDGELERRLARDLRGQRAAEPPEVRHQPAEANEVALIERHQAHERPWPRAP